jgi:uncharacterized protein involved in outer membrane biogenesis
VRKKALIAAAVLFVLAAGGAFWAYRSLDVIVKMALERYGPDVLGVPVHVSEVRISAQSGHGTLKGLEIGTPRGFSAARTAKLGEIRVAVEPRTLTERVVLVHEIAIEAPVITYERGRSGTNLDAIQKSIEAYIQGSGGSSEAKPAAAKGEARRFVIERLAIRGAKVTMTNPALKGQGVTFDLPDLQLRDIGKRQNGLRASEAANVVTNALIARIGQKVLTNIDLLRKGGVEGAVDALKGLLK